MELGPEHRVITIASGGCNALSYMTASPESLIAVDLNPAHIALTKLKLAAARHLPVYEQFRRFFGDADSHANTAAYRAWLRPHLDADTQRYWDKKRSIGRRRIDMFARRFYRHGLLGRFIGLAHLVARALWRAPRDDHQHGRSRRAAASSSTIISRPSSTRGWCAGSPAAGCRSMVSASRRRNMRSSPAAARWRTCCIERLRKLACDFPLNENYFAWQAFAPPLRHGRDGSAAALSAAREFRGDQARRRADHALSRLLHRVPQGASGREPRPLCAARCARLDDG